MPRENVMVLYAGDSPSVVVEPPVWCCQTNNPEIPKTQGDGIAVGAFVLVAIVHAVLVMLLMTRVVHITPPAEKQGGGPLRVRLVSMHTPQAPVPIPPVPDPVKARDPEPQKKVMATEAPRARQIEQSREPVAEPPKPVQPISPPVPVEPPPPQVAAQAPVADPQQVPRPTPAGGGPELAVGGVQAAPKEVGQLACRIPKPDYPRAARRQGQAGQVEVRLVVNEAGRVASADVTRGSGFTALDSAARQAALAGSCQPYREGNHAIRVTALQVFNFVPSD